MNDFPTITRYYGTHEQDLEKLWHFIDQAQTYSSQILIGVNIEKDFTDCIRKYAQRQQHSNVVVNFIPIKPWTDISTPLNILLNQLSTDQSFVLIQSVEIQCSLHHLARLRSYLKENDVLCVGAALDGHQLLENPTNEIRLLRLQGDTSPWNTLAMWNLEKLRRTGFPMCADLVHPPGMEDAAAIGLQQKLFGGREKNRALLIRFNANVRWSSQFDYDQQRSLKHQAKMRSKNSRTERLLELLEISPNDQEDQLGVEYICE